MALLLDIITPERTLFSGSVNALSVPTMDGVITILSNHEPLVSLLDSGEITLQDSTGAVRHMAVHGGFLEVRHNQVRLLTDAAELEEEIDARRAHESLERARQLREESTDTAAQAEALAAMERALARLKIAERRKLRHRA